MAQMESSDDLLEQLREVARRENRSVDEVVTGLLRRYAPPQPRPVDADEQQRRARGTN